MRNHTYSGLVALCAAAPLFCAPDDAHPQEYDWASIDEESFESVQPTGKIMDTIGITKGMAVGEVGAPGVLHLGPHSGSGHVGGLSPRDLA